MKLYNCATAPNPRRVRFFLAEKGITVDMEEVDIIAGDNLKPGYLKINAAGLVPVLQLDDGTNLCEAPAICRYLESQRPLPNLMGANPLETASVEAWDRFAELNGMQAAGEVFRNSFEPLKTRGLPGSTLVDAIPALVERGKTRLAAFYELLERRLGITQYLAADRFTFADITACCVVDVANFLKLPPPAANRNTRRWHDAVSARPAAKA